ncbi:SGNH/GDSL hydrolase family protein [Rubritalea tangerina]|uniref:SGNH/GDSL hydrolase family protein n=1 Tax=Rubritalea tangerina TaxID=430798 RepID=A0ABW4ZD52_9BACT
MSAQQSIKPKDPRITVMGCRYVERGEAAMRFSRFAKSIASLPAKEMGFNWQKGQTTTGVRIGFETDSASVKLRFRVQEGEVNRGSQFGVFVNGEWFKSYDFKPKDGVDCSFSVGDGGAGLRQFEVVLPSLSNPQLLGIEIDEGASFRGVEKPKSVYVACGDSITHGVGQGSASYQTYGYLLAKMLGYDYYNLAVGGGKVSIPVARQLGDWERIDVITHLVGYNDWCFEGKSPAQYTEAYRGWLAELRKHHPEAEVYCIGMTYTKNTQSKKTDYKTDAYREGLEKLVAELREGGDQHLHYVAGERISSEKNLREDRVEDPVHFGIKGAALFAKALYPIVSGSGKQ